MATDKSPIDVLRAAAEAGPHTIRSEATSRELQTCLLATTSDAVVAIDPSRTVTYMNPSAERMYGVSSSDAGGKPLSELHGYAWLNPEDERRCWADLAEHGRWRGEYIHIRNDGVQLIVSATVNMLPEESGGGMVGVFRDVSARRQAELDLREEAARLSRANEDLTHFAHVVSHDLQDPLRTIISFSQLLAMKYLAPLDDQTAEFIRLIVEAGSRMSAMISDLLELARCAGDELVQNGSVSLADALSVAVESLRSEVVLTSAVITHGDLPVVSAEAGQLTQLFQNLIGNSLKYRKRDTSPHIRVSAERRGLEWEISVQDDGIGFEPRQADRIFGVFKRLHGAHEYSGTGIGLAICKRIVERRGGRIWATGAPGEGAVFTFSIPDEMPRSQPVAALLPLPRLQPAPAGDIAPASAPFDELFQMIDLAQAIVRDTEGKVLIWTQGAERLFGFSKKEAIGRNIHTLLGTVFPVPLQQIELELYTSGEWKGQLKKQRRDGSVVWVATHWSLYRDGSGRGQSVIEVDNDITSIKEADLRRNAHTG